MKTTPEKLLKKRPELIHTDDCQVNSHVQREEGDWIRHTLMIEGYEVPFVFKRQKQYQSLKGARVNLSYYPETKSVAGFEMEFMKVVRVRRA
ncbi:MULTISPECIES: hypothetical protein [Corallincola]|uniref:Uncharacterized protein n=3 Tax=Corallincola TaxID=1775176 RepID=A0A368N8U5_9GAMM|nr:MULTISPECIES: hypothetical protein [Corallincola]RCU45699.1 hypothetical protein DU002_14670 [Corallincola holothuriorum]TAA41812.1 hypothetical protein EXY25_16390 [Corallincola spongiicola]TCI02194.1 hypothetical protein EZV61_14755 [Corallincola luteus]